MWYTGWAREVASVEIFLDSGYTPIVLSNYGMSGQSIVERIRAMVGKSPTP